MEALQPSKFENFLNKCFLSAVEIEEQVEQLPALFFMQERDETIEHETELPPFVKTFYNYINSFQKIPGQQVFYESYLHEHKEKLGKNAHASGLKARIFRAYPSFVRDFHFALLTKEQMQLANVLYNTSLDIEHNIDVLIEYHDSLYGICLHVNTANANQEKRKKDTYDTKFSNVTYIDLPITLTNRTKRKVNLYNQDSLIHLKKLLNYV
ncbi:hypothetical protein ACI6Q2_03270 [Chitinophagaceae bacterium LWZ2-11]